MEKIELYEEVDILYLIFFEESNTVYAIANLPDTLQQLFIWLFEFYKYF